MSYLQPEDGLQKIADLTKSQNGIQKLNKILDICYYAIKDSFDLEEGNTFRMSKESAMFYLDPQYRVMRLLQEFAAGRITLATINNLTNTARLALEQDLELEKMIRDDVLEELADKNNNIEEKNNGETGESESQEAL